MQPKPIQTDQAPAAIGPYSQAVVTGPWVFVSGQLGLIPQTGEMAGPEFTDQARRALENVKAILAAAGSSIDHVVSVEVFLTEMERFAEFNGVYGEYFNTHKPARAVVAVRALPKNAAVEIKCMAALANARVAEM